MKLSRLALPVALCVSALAADTPVTTVEEIIAKVNGDIITRSEMDRSRAQLEAQLRQRGATGAELQREVEERSKNILRERIDQLLLVQKGREMSINVDPEVSKYIAEIQLQTKIADPEKFQEFVREQTGQTFEDYKADIKNGMLTQRVVRQEVGGRINIPRAELEKYYNEHKAEFMREDQVFLREIFLSIDGKSEAEIAAVEKKARDLVARARKGERFGDLARDNSEAATAKDYGQLPPFKLGKGELLKQIEDLVSAQERGYVSDPIRLEKGFLIVRVDERHKAGQATFEEVENQVMEKLYMPRMEPAVREYLTRLRHEAFLEIKPGYVDTAAAPGKDTAWTDPAQLKPETVTKEEVEAQTRRRRLLWLVPIPGTKTTAKGGTSSSK
jgi:parvulin-like peptidyl-prolyl isomerase